MLRCTLALYTQRLLCMNCSLPLLPYRRLCEFTLSRITIHTCMCTLLFFIVRLCLYTLMFTYAYMAVVFYFSLSVFFHIPLYTILLKQVCFIFYCSRNCFSMYLLFVFFVSLFFLLFLYIKLCVYSGSWFLR